jgi:cell division protein FtsB
MKEKSLQDFETVQFQIVSYQDELNELVEELQKENAKVKRMGDSIRVPEEFLDPITQEIMATVTCKRISLIL